MRILVVRGRNLASLAGHFEVDFDRAPLDQAGLIAITGPTGAGKTTLLDAMCLALFDRTPRFANRGGVLIGNQGDDGGLRASDVRGILRHGAVEGWAEVDFLGVDDRRWRARWEVRRARNRAEGRIQAQQMKLIDPVDGAVIAADRKSDTLVEIERRLGLDFDQFRRSVLLAQGEFAAFLEASGGERAELLERMTGTWLYRELGRGAFERAKQAERELELVERERVALRLLEPEARATLEAELGRDRGRQAELERGFAEAEAALRWHQRRAALELELDQARAKLAQLDERQDELAQTERRLAQVERLAAVRERLATLERWTADLDASTRDLAFIEGELPLIENQRNSAKARLGDHEQALDRARERRRRLEPDLDRARELDTRVSEAQAQKARLAAKLEGAEQALAEAQRQHEAIAHSQAEAEARLERAKAWLGAHAGLAPMADHWPHYRSMLVQHQRALGHQAELRGRVARLEPQAAKLDEEVVAAEQARDRARSRRSQAKTRLRKVERELDQLPALAQLRHRQAEVDGCRERLVRLRGVYDGRERLLVERGELQRERHDHVIERDHRERERGRVDAELAAREQLFVEAQHGLRQLEAVRDLVEHRAELRSGEPCPVCGSTEHPAAEERGPVDEVIAAQRRRVEALLRERDELQREQGEHLGRELLTGQRLAAIDRRLAELGREDQRLAGSWRELLDEGPVLPEPEPDAETDAETDGETPVQPETGTARVIDVQLTLLGPPASGRTLPEALDDPQLGTALWAVQEQLDVAGRSLARERDTVEGLLDRQRERQARRDEAEADLEQCQATLVELERKRDKLRGELAELGASLDRLDDELRGYVVELGDVGPAALASLDDPAAALGPKSDPSASFRAALELEVGQGDGSDTLLARLDAGVSRFLVHRQGRDQAREGLRALDPRLAELRSRVAARREAQAAVKDELGALDELLIELRDERGATLGGRPVAAVLRELERVVELAQREREASKDALARVEREFGAQRTRAHTLREQVQVQATAKAEAADKVARALADVGLEAALVDELLGQDELWTEDWTSATRRSVDAARAERSTRRAVVDERERVVSEHLAGGPPSLDVDQAKARRAELEAELEALRGATFEVEHRLRRDAEDRARAAELAPRLDARAHAARVWGRLRDAIGSATGDKFQKFAQSLTLELLLTQANVQLRELKPRYALARVPNHDLELQLVDHDLGDEVRSIRGLSGGEKFLVSLALALALASLAAEDCRIDSLFIDEGFGTLDAHSLDVAVSTLDALQAEGRQIGVISHVPGLAERIGVEIRVEPVSSGRSRVRVVGPGMG